MLVGKLGVDVGVGVDGFDVVGEGSVIGGEVVKDFFVDFILVRGSD